MGANGCGSSRILPEAVRDGQAGALLAGDNWGGAPQLPTSGSPRGFPKHLAKGTSQPCLKLCCLLWLREIRSFTARDPGTESERGPAGRGKHNLWAASLISPDFLPHNHWLSSTPTPHHNTDIPPQTAKPCSAISSSPRKRQHLGSFSL